MTGSAPDWLYRHEWLSDSPPRFHVRSHVGHYGPTVLGVALVPIWVFYGVVPTLAVVVALLVGVDNGFDGGWNAATDSCMKYPDRYGRTSEGGRS